MDEMGSSLLLAEDEASGPSLGFILGKHCACAMNCNNSLLLAEDEASGPSLGFILGKYCVVLPTLRFFIIEIFRFFCFRLKKNLTNVYFSL
jgi:hypothetical protein